MMKPPRARRAPTERGVHGRRKVDDYAWLEDSAWSEVLGDVAMLRPEHRAHLEAENAYAAAEMAPHDALRRLILEELRARQPAFERSAVLRDGPWTYFAEMARGSAHPELRRSGPRDELLVDGNAEALDRAFFRLGPSRHSPDHALFAYGVDDRGGDSYAVYVKRLADGAILDQIDHVTSFAWSPDARAIVYVQADHHRPRLLRRRTLGEPASADPLLFEETDPAFFLAVAPSSSGHFVVVEARDHETSEVWVLDAARLDTPLRSVVSRVKGRRCTVADRGDELFLLHDGDDAEDFMISRAPLAEPERDAWRPVVAHRRGRYIRDYRLFRDHIAYLAIEDAVPILAVRRLEDGVERIVELDDPVCDVALEPASSLDDEGVRFRHSSMRTPPRICELRFDEKTPRVLHDDATPSHDPDRYVATRVHATAADGEAIPISIVHARETAIGEGAPLLLYVYGSYGAITPASFDAARISLLDRGFVYAIAHVRGGRERGRRWYEGGKGMLRPNAVNDLIASARWLIAHGYARSDGVVLHGASAGGTLVAAAMNAAPSLFRAVVAEVPFVDVLATLCDEAQPLTPREHREWGDPTASAEAYDLLASYSPIDNVVAARYPHVLATAGVADPWVPWWEPAKWIATLRERTTGGARVLLETAMTGGHRGGAGRGERLAATARILTFVATAK